MLIPYTGLDRDELRIAMTKNFGVRMRAAREMCGLSQLDASPLFGLANSSRLAKVEQGSYSAAVSIHMIALAVEHYKCGSDYLLGFSNYHQRDIREIRENAVRDILADYMAGEFDEIRRLAKALDAIAASLEQFEAKTAEALQVLIRFSERNPEFEDMPGGAKLDRLVRELRQDIKRSAGHLAAVRESLRSPCPGTPS